MARRLLICVPTGTGMLRESVVNGIHQLSDEAVGCGFTVRHKIIRSALVYGARYDFLKIAAASEAHYMMCMDDDMLVHPGSLRLLWDALYKHPSKFAGVSGMIAARTDQVRFAISFKHPFGLVDDTEVMPDDILDRTEPVEVQGFGAAYCLWHVPRVLAALKLMPDMMRLEDTNPFLPIVVGNEAHNVLGEDLAFCKRLKDGGARLAVHPQVQPGHYHELPLMAGDALGIERAAREMGAIDEDALRANAALSKKIVVPT